MLKVILGFILQKTLGFETISPLLINNDFFCSNDLSYVNDDIEIQFWNTNILNYSDRIHKQSGVYSGDTLDGICGNVHIEFSIDESIESLNGTVSYYSQCNLSDTIHWKWDTQSLCNISNAVCIKVKQDDIFYIHKDVYRVYQIDGKEMTYEQIAYIQPEIWVIVISCCFLCCFGVHSFSTSESGKIVT